MGGEIPAQPIDGKTERFESSAKARAWHDSKLMAADESAGRTTTELPDAAIADRCQQQLRQQSRRDRFDVALSGHG